MYQKIKLYVEENFIVWLFIFIGLLIGILLNIIISEVK